MGKKKKTLGAGKKKIYFCTKVILSLACVLCSPPPSFSFLLWAVIYVVEKRLIWRGKRQFYSLKHFFFVRFFSLKAERSRPLRHLSVTVAFTLPFSACRYRMGMSSLIIHFFSLVYFFFFKRERDGIFSAVLCELFWCSLFHGQKKRLLKKTTTLNWAPCFLFVIMSGNTSVCREQNTKQDFIKTRFFFFLSLQLQTYFTKIHVGWWDTCWLCTEFYTVWANLEVRWTKNEIR